MGGKYMFEKYHFPDGVCILCGESGATKELKRGGIVFDVHANCKHNLLMDEAERLIKRICKETFCGDEVNIISLEASTPSSALYIRTSMLNTPYGDITIAWSEKAIILQLQDTFKISSQIPCRSICIKGEKRANLVAKYLLMAKESRC
jgi:hypothetical protein